MKRQIIVEIDCEDDDCGRCVHGETCGMWKQVPEGIWFKYARGTACLAAERKLRDLVEAGEGMKRRINAWFTSGREPEETTTWDAALAAIKGER